MLEFGAERTRIRIDFPGVSHEVRLELYQVYE
jgi:hypothetical protein